MGIGQQTDSGRTEEGPKTDHRPTADERLMDGGLMDVKNHPVDKKYGHNHIYAKVAGTQVIKTLPQNELGVTRYVVETQPTTKGTSIFFYLKSYFL